MDPLHKAEGIGLFVFNKTFFLLPDHLPRLLFIHFPGLQSVAGLTDTNLDPPVGSEGIRRGANHRGRYSTPHETGPATGGGALGCEISVYSRTQGQSRDIFPVRLYSVVGEWFEDQGIRRSLSFFWRSHDFTHPPKSVPRQDRLAPGHRRTRGAGGGARRP